MYSSQSVMLASSRRAGHKVAGRRKLAVLELRNKEQGVRCRTGLQKMQSCCTGKFSKFGLRPGNMNFRTQNK